jgi:hypothetical protein
MSPMHQQRQVSYGSSGYGGSSYHPSPIGSLPVGGGMGGDALSQSRRPQAASGAQPVSNCSLSSSFVMAVRSVEWERCKRWHVQR